jgi:hypothetical protein
MLASETTQGIWRGKKKDCPTPMVIKQMKEPPNTGSEWVVIWQGGGAARF